MMMKLKPCSILVVMDKKRRSAVEGIIEAVTGDGHHTANVLADGESIIEATAKHGVKQDKLSKYLNRKDAVLVFQPKNLTQEQIDLICSRWLEWDGARYDFGGVFWQLFRIKTKTRKDIFCSRLSQYGPDPIYKIKGLPYKEFAAAPADIVKSCLYQEPKFFDYDWLHNLIN